MVNLDFLSNSEKERILEVLQRDEELRHADDQRVRKLKTDLQEVKRKGAKRGSGKYSQRICGRCLEPLSPLILFNSKCAVCSHDVCRNCRTILANGSWVCNVCDKESDVKKKTGEWFYDQNINRFSAAPGHDLVRLSLKRPLKKNETTGQVLLRNCEITPAPSSPVPQPRQKNKIPNKSTNSESAEKTSIQSGKTDTASGPVTPDPPRRKNRSDKSSPAGSSVSSLSVAVKADGDSDKSEAKTTPGVKPASSNPDLDVDRLFKKSIKRAPKPQECVSTLDLRDGFDHSETSMGNRSKSVPGLDVQEAEEEDEDIDSLVSLHKRTMASSSSSLHSSKSAMGSLMSVYSEAGDFDSVDVCGDVIFSLSYDEHTQSLQVFIKECHGLAYGDASRQLSNPYVKCYLLPDKSRQSKRKTSVKRNTINPVFKETLKYSISRTQLFTRSMLISVWHHGRFSRNAFLGEVEISLDSRDLDSPYEDCMVLMGKASSAVPSSPFAQYKGELVISLKYVTPKMPTEKNKGKKVATEEGELHVLIKEANNLMAVKLGGTSDSFVKGNLFPTKEKTSKRKTPVVKKNLNPHYDHTFVYKELALEQLKGMCLELTVWDREAMSSNEFLGGVRLSSGKGTVKMGKEEVEMDSVGEEVSLWEKMMQYPDSWAEGTLPLRSTMGKVKGK